MRKRRAIVVDDEITIVIFLKHFFSSLGYDVMASTEPLTCPVYAENSGSCSKQHPCADVIITDNNMPRMKGLELLQAQADRGCKLSAKNKAVLSGYIDNRTVLAVKELGSAFFDKPVELNVLEGWVKECEQRTDLSQPLGERRKESRIPVSPDLLYTVQCPQDTVECSAVDISHGGFCLKLPVRLQREQAVQVASQDHGVPRAATVRWISRQDDGSYLTGLSCR
jgi:CheY-like chemotaxis protein